MAAPEPAQVLTVACDSARGIAVLFRAEVSTLRSALGHLQTLAHARDNDEFLITRAHHVSGEVDSDEYEKLRRRSRSVIPASWATAESRYECPLYSIRHLAAQPYRQTGVCAASAGARHRQLRLQYLHLQPFVHEGTTYLLSAPPSWALSNEDTFVLFRPATQRPLLPPPWFPLAGFASSTLRDRASQQVVRQAVIALRRSGTAARTTTDAIAA